MAENLINDLWKEALTFEMDENYKLSVGALDLYINLQEKEWQFRHSYATQDEIQNERKLQLSKIKTVNSNELVVTRFIHSDNVDSLHIKPRLANRNIVAKPYSPILLPSQQEITIYISTPVWLAISSGTMNEPLVEMPTFQLSDTWFGPKPHIGELCYSRHFTGRIDLNVLPKRMSRVITPVRITNNGEGNLKLEKISIPCDYLAIYQNKTNELWTPTLSVIRHAEHNKTEVKIDRTLHPALAECKKIAEPRVSDQKGLLSKTIDMLFS